MKKENLSDIVSSSISFRQVLLRLNLKESGGNYRMIQKKIRSLKLDTSHFLGRSHNKGKAFGYQYPLQDYLSNKRFMQSNELRKRLVSEGIFDHKCYSCNRIEWLGKQITIELHHIDGNNKNNNLENLQLLCPNCHSMTENWRGKGKKQNSETKTKVSDEELINAIKTSYSRREALQKCDLIGSGGNYDRVNKILLNNEICFLIREKTVKTKRNTGISRDERLCIDCKKKITYCSNRCKSCSAKKCNKTKIDWPTTDKLKLMVNESNYTQVAKSLGVSDNAIRKRIRNH